MKSTNSKSNLKRNLCCAPTASFTAFKKTQRFRNNVIPMIWAHANTLTGCNKIWKLLGEVAAGNRVADALPITRAMHCGSAHADGGCTSGLIQIQIGENRRGSRMKWHLNAFSGHTQVHRTLVRSAEFPGYPYTKVGKQNASFALNPSIYL